MITIYCDFYRLHEIKLSRDTIVVGKIQEYIPLRQQLRRILDERDANYTVYVQNPILAEWLKDLHSYGSPIVRWVEISLQGHFEQRFGFPAPKELSGAAIRDVLSTLPSAKENMVADPVGWILSRRVDSVWEHDTPGQNHLINLAAWMTKEQTIPVLFQPLMRKRLKEWAEHDDRYLLFLENTWFDTAKAIFMHWVFRSYPASFTDKYQESVPVPLIDCSGYTFVCMELIKTYHLSLSRFWNKWLASDSQDIMVALQWMCGLADEELNVLESWVRRHPQFLTNQLLQSVKDRFSHHPNTMNVLEGLVRLLPPPVPRETDDVWSIEQWLDWVTEQYLPYFAWVIRYNQPRNIQIDRAYQFESWLIDIYPKLLLDNNTPFSPHQFGRIKDLFDTNEVDVILWFIVDGMTWWQGKKLINFCTEKQIEGMSIQPVISVLPTITSISKKALVQGYLDSDTTPQPIAQMLKTRFARESKQIQVYTQYRALERTFESDLTLGLYALLYNPLDHHSHEEQGFTDNESIDGHLRLIARLVKEGFNCCLRQGLRVKAFISSDHGSTLLPENASVLEVPRFAQVLEDDSLAGDRIQDEIIPAFQRSRVCATDRIPDRHNLSILEKDWHYLHKETFSLTKQYFIPKGYSAVERRPKGWTHGGATPEEVVVPAIELQPSKIDFMDIEVEIVGSLRLRQENRLQVVIRNTNAFPIRILQMIVANTTVEPKQRIVSAISTIMTEVSIPPINGASIVYPVNWFLICEGVGQRKEFKGRVDVSIRRLQVSDIDEMFEGE